MERDKLIKAKIPCEETGIEIKRTLCDICSPSMHCGIDAYIKDGKIIKIEGTKEHPLNKGLLCTKGLCNREYIYRKDRIKTPLKRVGNRGEGKFEPISWEEAYSYIGENLNRAKKEYGAKSVAFFTGYGKWYRPFLHRFAYSFGSPNYGTESSSCSTSSEMAWRVATGKSSSPDIKNSNVFLGWAYNPYHSRYLASIPVTNKKKEGMKIIIVDPRITPATQKLADLHLRLKPGTDGALALGMANLLIENDWIDKEFIKNHVHGFDEYREYVKQFDLDTVSKITGVTKEDIKKAVEILANNGPFSINESSAPVVHHQNGFQNYRAVMSLLAITGNYDRKGGNLPSDSTYVYKGAGFKTLEKEFIDEVKPKNINEAIGAQGFPLWNDMVDEFQAMDLARQLEEKTPYEVKALFCHGLNIRMFPNSERLLNAISNVDFFVNIDLFLTDTSKYADIVLPACSSFERGEFKVYQGGYASYTKPVIKPLYESKTDVEILSELVDYLDMDDDLLKSGYEECVKYILKDTSIDIENLKESELPLKVKEAKVYTPGDYTKAGYNTTTSKFELKSTIIGKFEEFGLEDLPTYKEYFTNEIKEFPYILTAGSRIPNALHSRLHDLKMSRILKSEPTVDINSVDARELNLSTNNYIKITTEIGTLDVKVNITDRVLPKNIHMYHGYREADVNSIICDNFDPYSGFPAYRSCRCKIEKLSK